MAQLSEWAGLVTGRNDDFDKLTVQAPLAVGTHTWSGPFRAVADDGNEYFVKCLETCPSNGESSLVAEYVVARMGALISAPVCHTSLIRIPEELSGWEPKPGTPIKPGIAHACRAIERVNFSRPPILSRDRDDNRRRHVGVYALFDWCAGSDEQWLYDLDNDHTIYSHDHGWYLPPMHTGHWTRDALIADVDTPHPYSESPANLSSAAIDEVASALEAVTRADLVSVLRQVPLSWPVTTGDLEALGWYLETRATGVAARLRALAV